LAGAAGGRRRTYIGHALLGEDRRRASEEKALPEEEVEEEVEIDGK